MARRLTCGFELLGYYAYESNWYVYPLSTRTKDDATAGYGYIMGPGRTGNKCYRGGDASYRYTGRLRITQLYTLDEFCLRWAWKYVAPSMSGAGTDILQIWSGTNYYGEDSTKIFRMRVLDSTLCNLEYLYNGTDWYQVGQIDRSELDPSGSVWHVFELRWKRGTSDGLVQFRIDGELYTNVTGIDTATGNPIYPYWICFGDYDNHLGAWCFYLDDIALNDTEGATNNSWPGLGGCVALPPTGQGDRQELTLVGSGLTANWQAVDAIPPVYVSESEYVTNSGPGQKDLYTSGSLPIVNGLVNAVVLHARVRNTAAGSATLGYILKSSGSEAQDDIGTINSTALMDLEKTLDVNPVTGNPWTIAEVNGLQSGPEII
jgi:hypothetical protein